MGDDLNTVVYCRFCGRLNSTDHSGRCVGCGAFSGLETVDEADALRRSRLHRLGFLRNRLFRYSAGFLPLLGVLLWVLWAYTDLPPDPPSPATNIGDTSVDSATGDWPQARGGITNSAAGSTSLSLVDVESPRVVWQHVAGAPIVAPPAVVGDRVYVGAEDGSLVALDKSTGRQVWRYDSGLPATVTPAVVDGLVFVVFRPGVVTVLDADTGGLQWSKRLSVPSLPSPTVADGRLFVAETHLKRLLALDAETGDQLWEYELGSWVVAPPTVINGKVIATATDSIMHVLDAGTGRRRMIYDAGQARWVRGAAVASRGLAHFSSFGGRVWGIEYDSRRYPLERQILYARTVSWIWGFSKQAPVQRGSVWSTQTPGKQPYAPALADGMLAVADTDGNLTALSASDGRILWAINLGSDVAAAPTMAGDVALAGTERGEVIAISVIDGSESWRLELNGAVTASPIVAGELLLSATDAGGGTLTAATLIADSE